MIYGVCDDFLIEYLEGVIILLVLGTFGVQMNRKLANGGKSEKEMIADLGV